MKIKENLKEAWDNLSNAGVSERYEDYLNKKIQSSNQMAVLLSLGLATPFTILISIIHPELIFVPVMGIFIPPLTIILNNLDYIYLSRVINSVLPTALASLYLAFALPAGDSEGSQLMALIVVFAQIPMVMWDLRERFTLIACCIITFALVALFPYYQGSLEISVDPAPVKGGWFVYVSVLISLLTGFGIVLFVLQLFQREKLKTEALLSEGAKQQEETKASSAKLQASLERMNEAQERERARNWQAEGIAELSSILRSNDSEEKILDRSVAYVTNYVNASIGAIYLVDSSDNDPMIEMKACYAYERKKFIDKSIHVGEGLIGQAYLEQRSIHLTEVPADYIKIKSGTGNSTPAHLMIVPLILNDEVEGFVEVASFEDMEDSTLEFLEKVAESLAVTINTQRINRKTRDLLEESQMAADQMRTQEEEMRQNMEELAATQEEMNRRETERSSMMEEMQQQAVAQDELLNESRRKTQFIHLFQSLAAATNQAADVKHATQMVLDLLCNELEWPIAHAFFLDPEDKNVLKPSEVWFLEDDDEFEELRSITMTSQLHAGEGMSGSVFQQKHPIWVEDMNKSEYFQDITIFNKMGLCSSFAFPVIVKDEVVSVLEFFSLKKQPADQALLEILDQIAYQLSRVYEFKLFEEKAEAAAFQYRATINDLEDKLEEYQNKFGDLD